MKIRLKEKNKQSLLEMCEKLLCVSQVGRGTAFMDSFLLFNNVSIMWISIHFSGQVAMNRKKILLSSKCSFLMC